MKVHIFNDPSDGWNNSVFVLQEHWNGDIVGYYVGYKKTSISEDKPYYFETVEFIKEQGHEHQLQISNLEVFTEYAIVVQAFNRMGQGPMSEEVLDEFKSPASAY